MPRIRLLLSALALLALLAVAPSAPAATTTVTTDADSWTNASARNRNYGSATTMRANQEARRPFIRFAVPALDGPVQRAVLRFEARTGAPDGLHVYSTSAGWSEGTLRHSNAPALDALVATVPGFSSRGWVEADVTSGVTGSGAHSFAITAPSAGSDVVLTSRQGGAAPQLVLTTEATTGQAPANTALPTVSGTAQQDFTLSASLGAWSGTAPLAYGYQWRRCDAAGASCVDIGGATGTAYALAAADVGRTIRVRVTASNASGTASAESPQTAVVAAPPAGGGGGGPTPGTVITTTRSWQCNGALSSFGPLPIKVVSSIPNPGTADAIRLIGCYGDGNSATVDLILDVRGDGGDLGTGYDAVKVGQSAHDLVITGNADCGGRSGSIHQDGVQVMSGERIEFRDFASGDPDAGRWTCWGSGGGFFISHVNGTVPTDVVCVRCRIAAYNQALRIQSSVRSGARDSVFGYSRSSGIYVGSDATSPVNDGNRTVRY